MSLMRLDENAIKSPFALKDMRGSRNSDFCQAEPISRRNLVGFVEKRCGMTETMQAVYGWFRDRARKPSKIRML